MKPCLNEVSLIANFELLLYLALSKMFTHKMHIVKFGIAELFTSLLYSKREMEKENWHDALSTVIFSGRPFF